MQGNNNVLDGGGIHHMGMNTNHFDDTVKFYKEVLGFKEALFWYKGDKRIITLDAGNGTLFEIFETDDSFSKETGVFKHIALHTTRIYDVIEKVKVAGMEVTMEPADLTIGTNPSMPVTIAFFKGPEREIIELFQNR